MSTTSSDEWEQIRKISEAYCEAFFEAMEPARHEFSKRIAAFQKTMQKETLSFGKAILSMAKKEQLARKMEEINKTLRQEGWFVPPILSEGQITQLHRLAVVNGDVDAAMSELIGYCEDGLPEKIVDAACSHKAFEHRTAFLRQALQAHVEGKFTLSIPVFLAQAEGTYLQTLEAHGIFNEAYLFKGKEWAEAPIEDCIDELPITEIVFASILRAFSVAMHEQFTARVRSMEDLEQLRVKYPKGFLSRHAVLHGRDDRYNTKENSIRALFILDTVRELVNRLLP